MTPQLPTASPLSASASAAAMHTAAGDGQKALARSLGELRFANSLPSTLRADTLTPGTPFERPAKRNQQAHVPRQVPGAHFSYVEPTPSPSPRLVSLNGAAAREVLGLDAAAATATPELRQELLEVLAGNAVPAGTHPWALSYGGHQFGSWAGQLGDGRAITLFEAIHPLTGARTEVQLKGAGLTPYSRFADGLAVLRSSIREYLCAEAMHGLGAPTSRSLSLVASDRVVQREFGPEPGAVVCRLAPSWIRFGSFELLYSRGEYQMLRELADYAISTHFPHILSEADGAADGAADAAAADTSSQDARKAAIERSKYVLWFRDVVAKTADMIAHWQAVGFCHGVMNTDNFSILGLTIDYGPFQFLDTYEPAYICNHSDETGRYAFFEQPRIALWNLARLASVLDPLLASTPLEDGKAPSIPKEESELINGVLADAVRSFIPRWDATFAPIMSKKLGFMTTQPTDMSTIYQPLLRLMDDAKVDYTHFFRSLSKTTVVDERLSDDAFLAWLRISEKKPSEWSHVPEAWEADPPGAAAAAGASTDAPSPKSLKDRFQDWFAAYRERLASELPSESMLDAAYDAMRQTRMLAANPKYVLRNHLVQNVIDEVSRDKDSNAVDRYLAVLQDPFSEGTPEQDAEFGGIVPPSMRGLKCSCSS
nr:hypothetical protein HK105_004239 [Polyrhizophydium stewartii]